MSSQSSLLHSNIVDFINGLTDQDKLEFIPSLINVPNPSGSDVDSNMVDNLNFAFYSPNEFCEDQNIRNAITKQPFSLIHMNIKSLATNHNMVTFLASLQHNFSVIGISETKIPSNRDTLSNIDITGYEFLSQPTL